MNAVTRFRERFSRFLIAILWANAGVLAVGTPAAAPLHSPALGLAGIALAALGTMIWRIDRTGWVTREVSSIVTMGQVMLLVDAFAGHPYQSDMHMYFFAMLAVLTGWLDWRIFVPATTAIVLHHLAFSLIMPGAVFLNGNQIDRVLLHGLIAAVQSIALSWLVWSLRQSLEVSERERHEADAARAAADEARRDLAETMERGALVRRQVLHAVADDFEREIAGIARDVIASVQSLRVASQQMKTGAVEVSERSTAASQSSRQTSSNVVAATQGTAELAQSFAEVDPVGELSRKAGQIGDITDAISTIAKHTNLLALNASIEAARLGQSGGGFTIVAQEIKSLANQTWRATEEIQSQIGAIRDSSSEAIGAIDAMNTTVGSLNQISGNVATVVEQQNAAAANIAQIIRRAADETVFAAGHIDIVCRIAAETDEAASHVAESADKLSRQSVHLDTEVAQFLGRIRAA